MVFSFTIFSNNFKIVGACTTAELLFCCLYIIMVYYTTKVLQVRFEVTVTQAFITFD